jgi:hypothetical protein
LAARPALSAHARTPRVSRRDLSVARLWNTTTTTIIVTALEATGWRSPSALP